MAFETKVILSLLADNVGNSKSIREAYGYIVKAANVEGLILPAYDQFIREKKSKRN